MNNLFRLKRLSYQLVSKGFYVVFFIAGFLCGLLLKNVNLIERINELNIIEKIKSVLGGLI